MSSMSLGVHKKTLQVYSQNLPLSDAAAWVARSRSGFPRSNASRPSRPRGQEMGLRSVSGRSVIRVTPISTSVAKRQSLPGPIAQSTARALMCPGRETKLRPPEPSTALACRRDRFDDASLGVERAARVNSCSYPRAPCKSVTCSPHIRDAPYPISVTQNHHCPCKSVTPLPAPLASKIRHVTP